MLNMNTKKIVVVGGGFAGLNFIKSLADHPSFQITLVDTNNFHFFPPLLYQVATAFIEPSNISYPFRRMFQQRENLRFHLGTLLQINPTENSIETDTGILSYDYLILAVGTETNYFGMEHVKQSALPMKTIGDSLNLRNHLLMSMEKAVRATDDQEREKYLTIVIAGGGPSGVEVAGMLAEMGQNIAVKEYPEIKNIQSRIHLIDAAPALLGAMSKVAQEEAKRVLTHLGVQIQLGVSVKDYVDEEVLLSNGQTIKTSTLIWTSGVIGKVLNGIPAENIVRGRRVAVDDYNRVKGLPTIFALGDIAFQTTDPNYPNGHPQLAQVAIQQGKLLALNLKRSERGEPLKPFRYYNKGSMAIISKLKAVADLPRISFTGFFAWLVWLFIHIIPIAGFRNKSKLAFNWFTAFISNDPTLRLIIRPRKAPKTS
jgi:NADH:ubiquinone reductase (H+-translocating)